MTFRAACGAELRTRPSRRAVLAGGRCVAHHQSMPEQATPQYHFADYARALREHYPSYSVDPGTALTLEAAAGGENLKPRADRFQQPEQRHFGSARNAWEACRGTLPTGTASNYKGLMRIKTPFDIVLYGNLVWELRPRTILEFGSLQGGGALWYADLLDAQAVEGGEVHSFDLMDKCVSPRAKHARLSFHHVDLFKLETLDPKLLARLPHPWLVIDDSHVNVLAVLRHVDRFVEVGDYYVLEDLGLAPGIQFVEGLQQACQLGYAIDTDYTDAFGYNVTAAPNGWLRKMRKV